MSLNSVFNRSLSGINVSQQGLAAASNNIANVNTKGYARQKVIISSQGTLPADPSLLGGATVSGLDTVTNSFVEMQLFTAGNAYGTLDGRKQTVSQMENVYTESEGNGLGSMMSKFFDSLNTASQTPASIPLRTAMVGAANNLTSRFNAMSQQLNSMKGDLSTQIAARLTTINTLASQIANLNQNIVQNGGPGQSPDLIVQRTYALRELSKEVNCSYFQDTTGAVQVQLSSGGTIVEGASAGSLSVTSDNLGTDGTIAVSLTYAGSPTVVDVTSGITSGRLGGNILDRNSTLNTQIDNLDTLAYQFATQFNTQYQSGYGLDGIKNRNFFVPLGATVAGASANIKVDASVSSSTAPNGVGTIALASKSGAAGDGSNGLALYNLQSALLVPNGSANVTFNQYCQTQLGDVGTIADNVNKNYDIQSYQLNQTEILRESISGVNMDEEGASIIQFQKAFEAASKVMTIADSLMEEILKI